MSEPAPDVPATGSPSPGSPGEHRAAQLAANLAAVEQALAAACTTAARARAEVTLIAVSKTWPASDVAALAALGTGDFGESKDQEAVGKVAEVPGVRWHFVGRLQRNKARSVAAYADLVHSVDRPELVRALDRGAAAAQRRLPVLVQVRLDEDPGRGGAPRAAVLALADEVAGAEHLELAGVMAVAPLHGDPERAFAALAEVAADVRAGHPAATDISAGMSGDFPVALRYGATKVRVGTALFGGRPPVLR